MKKQVLSLLALLIMSGASYAQFTAAQIWNLNLRVDPIPHNSINMLYFDMAITYNSRGIPLTGLSSAQPGLPLPTFKISSTVEGNKVICLSQEKEDNDPWEDKERATFESNGTYDTSVTIENSNNGAAFEKNGKIVIAQGGSSNLSIHHTYRWANNTWELNNKSFYYFSANKLDSMVTYKYTSSVDSLRNSFIIYYYSNGLDSSLHSILQTSTNQFEVQNKVLVLQKEAGKTKKFAVESRNTTGGPFQRTATFTYNNSGASALNETFANTTLSVYPNPANEKIKIQLSAPLTINAITILNLNGALIKESMVGSEIDIADLKSGIYLIQVNSDKGIYTQKFVKN
ncbi:MAG: T9SS type A sorting domain-containing protein [Bacteroidia bacterium]|nr:T9SS type A sorting domain-containing protein [Bacteroidia bacterium]MCF8427364.1 T9SS type A sorting domain-containing protein [Bacteroidia bacterium]MCF8447812.1 T9SS type A sorting domain-containing protein [Bacteroidia bacterium]